MTLKNAKKKQTTTQSMPKQFDEKPLKASYYDGLEDEQDVFDREMLRMNKKLASKKIAKSPPKKQ